jgi:hypothetical protein
MKPEDDCFMQFALCNIQKEWEVFNLEQEIVATWPVNVHYEIGSHMVVTKRLEGFGQYFA